MKLSIPLVGPGGEAVEFFATINSHGVAVLPPAKPDAELAEQLQVSLRLGDGSIATVVLRPGKANTVTIEVLGGRVVDRALIVEAVRHILRLDQDLGEFYQLAAVDPLLDWVTTGYGRMMRCQSVFQDVIKTVLTTNCAWSATVRMVGRIVSELGDPDPSVDEDAPFGRTFPTPAQMAVKDEQFYREVIKAGYRAPHLVKLSNAVANEELDLEYLDRATHEELPDEELERQLLALPGVGPYAAAHIMHMLGRCSRLVFDSWTRPTYAKIIGVEEIKDDEIVKRFARYGSMAGLAYWMTVTRPWFDAQTAGEAL